MTYVVGEPGHLTGSFAQAAGTTRSGATVSGVTVWNRALGPHEVKARYEAQKGGPVNKEQVLSQWLESKCMKANGVFVTRRDVIKYVANKLGGVHIDPRRDAKKYPGYIALDQARTLQVLDLDSVYAELTAIAQQLRDSPDLQSLT